MFKDFLIGKLNSLKVGTQEKGDVLIMTFDEFCETNRMTDEEIQGFKAFLEKRKDNLEARSIHNWLYSFNIFFDKL